MNPTPVTIEGETTLVPRLRVQQVIDLSTRRFERERLNLIADLTDAGVEAGDRLIQLRKQRDEAGLSAMIIRSAFSTEGSKEVVAEAMGGQFPESFASIAPDELSRLALACLGVTLDDKAEEGRAEGKA